MKRPVNLHQRRRWSLRRIEVVPDHVIRRATAHIVGGGSKLAATAPGGIAQSRAGSQRIDIEAGVTPANSRRYGVSWFAVIRAILGVIIAVEIALVIIGAVVY